MASRGAASTRLPADRAAPPQQRLLRERQAARAADTVLGRQGQASVGRATSATACGRAKFKLAGCPSPGLLKHDGTAALGVHAELTPNGYAFEGLKLFTLANACGMLASKNLTTIHMIGDSFVRHAYIALGMVLADDYDEAMLAPDWRARVAVPCGGDAIFGLKECRPLLRNSVRVCHGGRVTLTFKEHGQASPAMLRESSVVVWGDSNHPVDMNYTSRCGIHDADIFTRAILEPRCPAIVAQNLSAKLVWLGTHRRLGPVNGRWAEPHFDEELESVHAFLRQLGPVLGCLCGVSRFVDTWGFTSALVRQLPSNESEALTFDGVHWQRAVNVIKAHLLLKAILGGTEP